MSDKQPKLHVIGRVFFCFVVLFFFFVFLKPMLRQSHNFVQALMLAWYFSDIFQCKTAHLLLFPMQILHFDLRRQAYEQQVCILTLWAFSTGVLCVIGYVHSGFAWDATERFKHQRVSKNKIKLIMQSHMVMKKILMKHAN